MFLAGNVLIAQPFHPLYYEDTHEKKLEGLEEARTAALEMAKEEDEAPKEGTEDAQTVGVSRLKTHHMGVWGNTVSSRAPVTGMITNGYSEGPGDVLAR